MDQQVLHRFYVLCEGTHFDVSFRNDDDGTQLVGGCSIRDECIGRIEMSDGLDRVAGLLGRAAMDVWGDIPRDVQEALFETAMKGREAEREQLARLLHDRHPRTQHPAKPS
jgi:hypothetical protein